VPIQGESMSEQKSKNNKTVKLILIFIAVFIILFLAVSFGMKLYNQYMIDKPVETTVTTTEPTSTVDDKVQNPIDFASLQENNSDIYAYIKVDDTNVDYPIVQSSSDDEFYLKHSAEDKSWSASGAIYTESANSKTFNDRVTVIYGHNGYGDTFFTTLHKFEDEEFFNNHPYFYIYTPERKLTYQIISAFKYDDRHIMNSFNFADTTEFEEFEQYILNPSSASRNVRSELDTTVDANSNIVVLSTCITNQKSSRYLVCGVLVKDEQTY
jgi:sortase B